VPFQSSAQRRFLWAKHPAIAKRWMAEEKSGHYKKSDKKYSKIHVKIAREMAKA